MLFNALVFLYLFLPLCLVMMLLVPRKFSNQVLLLASIVFYAWGGPVFLTVIFASVIFNYGFGYAISNIRKNSVRKGYFIAGIITNLLMLIVFKYTSFLMENLNVFTSLFGWKPILVGNIILPLGISFFTFKAISFLVYIYGQEPGTKINFIHFGLYIFLFPQLISGPIDRFHDLAPQIETRSVGFSRFGSGIRRFALGLFKKVIISTPLGYCADQIFNRPAEDLNSALVWLASISYTLQVYYDFSGYTDMAIGLGRMFGFRFAENFNFPYMSKSIREFWNRWHMSLSFWFRDYLFQPLAYSTAMKLRKKSYFGIRAGTIVYISTSILTFLLCGFWHGAAWTFIVWGLIHGIFLSLEKTAFGKWIEKAWSPLANFYVIMVLVLSFVFFRAPSLTLAIEYLKIMSGLSGTAVFWPGLTEFLDREFILILLIAIAGCTPVFKWLHESAFNRMEFLINKKRSLAYQAIVFGGVFLSIIISTIALVSGTNNSFLYFKF